MKQCFSFVLLLSATLISITVACKNGGPALSSYESDSHHAGRSCIKCHNQVTVCGTVYDSTQKSVVQEVLIKFSTTRDSSGIIRSELEVDKNGNFYSDRKITFEGLFPLVVHTDGTGVHGMQSAVKTGDCNSCHIKGNRIWINRR